MVIAQDFQGIDVVSDDHRFISPPKQLSVLFISTIETLGIGAVDMPHTPGDIAVRRVQQKMIVSRDQAIACHLKIEQFYRLLQDFDEDFIVPGSPEYLLSSPAPVHDMIPGARIFNSQWSGHDLIIQHFLN